MVVIDNATGQEVTPGDEIVSFRGEKATLGYPDAPADAGRSGKVCVLWQPSGQRGWYYDKVFGLTVLTDGDYAARLAVDRFIDAQ
jgi:hypothetical protein